jgi:hypothetical protein
MEFFVYLAKIFYDISSESHKFKKSKLQSPLYEF